MKQPLYDDHSYLNNAICLVTKWAPLDLMSALLEIELLGENAQKVSLMRLERLI